MCDLHKFEMKTKKEKTLLLLCVVVLLFSLPGTAGASVIETAVISDSYYLLNYLFGGYQADLVGSNELAQLVNLGLSKSSAARYTAQNVHASNFLWFRETDFFSGRGEKAYQQCKTVVPGANTEVVPGGSPNTPPESATLLIVVGFALLGIAALMRKLKK